MTFVHAEPTALEVVIDSLSMWSFVALARVIESLALEPHHVAMVGDRLFTDVLCGNRLGLYTVLVRPVGEDGSPCHHDRVQRLERRLARWMGAPVA